MQILAQRDSKILKKIEKCIQDYEDNSSLGNPGSTFIDSATIGTFKDLFESNANHYWDLYKNNSLKTNYLLPVDAYTDSVNVIYNGTKPVISFGKYDIKIHSDRKTAIVYLVKINSLPDEKSIHKQKFIKHITTLRMLLNIYPDVVLIQNVSRDTRLTRIRSIYLEWGYPFLTNISTDFFKQPVSNIAPSVTNDYSIGTISGYSAGISTDIRLDRQKADGIVVNAGFLFTKTNFSLTISNYIYSYRQTFDPGYNAYECTVFDRAPSISEKISLSSISMPIMVKWYISKRSSGKQTLHHQEVSSNEKKKSNQPLRLKYYLKAGPQFSLLYGNAKVEYDLSHTGGGWFIYEREKNLPDPEKRWFYLDEKNERFDGPDFFATDKFSYSSSINLNKFQVSAVLAFGIEAKFNKILIGLEPWLNIGITSISRKQGNTVYRLYPTGEFSSFIQTYNSPRINAFGLNIIIGKIFTRKY
jgi:hypothetical protein